MKIRPLIAGVLAVATLVVGMPTSAGAHHRAPQYETVVDAVVATSGAPGSGFDRHYFDYDILREALVATDLVGAVAGLEDITVFAPHDLAFVRLARDLGYRGWNEAEAFATIAEATGYVSAAEPGILPDVLLYHVAPEAMTVRQLRRAGDIPTLLEGATVDVRGRRVVDADRDDRNAYITWPANLRTGNGIIQTVNRVLRPIDLP